MVQIQEVKDLLIIGLNGSPRRNGSTAHLLTVAMEVAADMGAETRLIHIAEALEGQTVPFCQVCTPKCTGKCSRGTKLGELFDLFRQADGMIIGSPVYFGTVSGQLKGVWDKTRFLRSDKALLNVVGGAVTVGGARFGGQETTLRAIHDMMLVQGMTVVGDGWRENDSGHQGGCAQNPAEKDDNARSRVTILAKRVVQVAESTKSLRLR
jgi:multimeric flavodoxin WrbA